MTGFSFCSEFDGEQYSSFSRLVKYNNGLFKSEKQASFLLKRVFHLVPNAETSNEKRNWFGVTADIGQYTFMVDASMRWADYGPRSVVPISWVFVADAFGIVRQYKIKYKGNLRDGAGPDPTRTELLWERPSSVQETLVSKAAEKPAEPVEQEGPVSVHLGTIGKRQVFSGKVVSVREFRTENRFHYYDSGIRYQTVIDVDGSKVVYWNLLQDSSSTQAEVGSSVVLSASVKDHTEYKGVKQTIISRATKVLIM